jgi:hypothetical protein
MSATRSRHSAAGSARPRGRDEEEEEARRALEVTVAAKASWEVVQPIRARETLAAATYREGALRWLVAVHYKATAAACLVGWRALVRVSESASGTGQNMAAAMEMEGGGGIEAAEGAWREAAGEGWRAEDSLVLREMEVDEDGTSSWAFSLGCRCPLTFFAFSPFCFACFHLWVIRGAIKIMYNLRN